MITGDPALIEFISAEIRAHGAIPFARFMELALYQPQHGYYASGRARIGRNGDFFTNVSVGRIFGRLLAAQFLEIWEQFARPANFLIVEQGAHDGAFARDVLCSLRDSQPESARSLSYAIIEPFAPLRRRQEEMLGGFGSQVRWVESLDALEPFTGIHFSNELFDALPVHLLEFAAGGAEAPGWRERCVTLTDDKLAFVLKPVTNPELLIPLKRLPTSSHPGYLTEMQPAADRLMRAIAKKIERGVILTIDYGFSRAEFYSTTRRQGTLQGRAAHRKLASPLEKIGYADISSHVAWTSLVEAAAGLANSIGFTDQHHFLAGILSNLISPAEAANLSDTDKRALQTLLHPEMLGRSFQALALGKDFTGALSGFQLARPAREALGW